jgi:hypothetical protein
VCFVCETISVVKQKYLISRNPIPPGSGLKWKPTTPNSKNLTYLYIGGPQNLEMQSNDKLGDPDFWDSLPINEKQLKVDTPINVIHTEL